jgi:8-oxo-dGTP pyrophosphatase MutT (NUDIX family)
MTEFNLASNFSRLFFTVCWAFSFQLKDRIVREAIEECGVRLDSLDDLLIPTNFLTANFFDCHRFLRNLSPSKDEARLSREYREVQRQRDRRRDREITFSS